MTDPLRPELDALDLLMQDHREMEALFRDFEHLQRNRKDTSAVVAAAFAELKLHDTLKTEVFYSAVADADAGGPVAAMIDAAEDEQDMILELMERLEQTRDDPKAFDTRFAVLADRVQRQIVTEETKLFPLAKALRNLDLVAVGAEIRKRRPELVANGV